MQKVVLAVAIWSAMTAATLAQPGRGNPFDQMMAADANRDGAISKDEARTGREAQFRRADANNDGFVTAEERAAGAQKKRGGAMGGADKDDDGKVSLAEFLGAPYRGFDMFDANRNDVLEATEIQAARDRFAQRKAGTP